MEEEKPMSPLCRTQAIIVCFQMLIQIFRQGAAKVLPFHIALTLNTRVWNLSDLGLIMMFLNFGKILNCIILTWVTNRGSKIVLIVHHYFVIGISVVGFCILGSAELGLVPDSQLVLTYVFGSLAMGTGYEEVLNLQVLISNFITQKVIHQATITSWMMTIDPVGYFALYAGSAVILEQSGYLTVLITMIALGLISAVLLTVNLLLFWKNDNAEGLQDQSSTPGQPEQSTSITKVPNAEATNKDQQELPEATLSNIWAEMTPSMYLLQLMIVVLYATFNYSFVLVPYILLSQLNVSVAFLGYAASIANLVSLIVARGFAWLDWNYPYEIFVHCSVMYLGLLAVPINFNVQFIALVGFCMINTGMTNAYISEPKIRVLLSPTWALTRVVGLIGLSRQPLKPVAAVLAPAMLTWSPAGASTIYTVCAGVNIVGIFYVFFERSAMLTRKLYVPELDQKNGKSLTPSEINALIEKRRKIIYLSYAEMEQMNYTGKTFDIPDEVAEEICSTVVEQKATDLFEVIQNRTASAMVSNCVGQILFVCQQRVLQPLVIFSRDQSIAVRLGTAVTLGETLREIDIGYTTKTVDLASINPAISTAAESSEFFSTAYAVRRLGQITSSTAVQTTEGTFVPPYFSQTGGTIPSLVGSLFTQDIENYTTLARQISSVRIEGIREDEQGDE